MPLAPNHPLAALEAGATTPILAGYNALQLGIAVGVGALAVGFATRMWKNFTGSR